MLIDGKYEPSITVTLWGYHDDQIALEFVQEMVKRINEKDEGFHSFMQVKIERSEGEGPGGVFFACEGPTHTVRPMLAAVIQEGPAQCSLS